MNLIVGAGIAAGAMLLAPAVVAALPCAVVSAGALMAVGYLSWRTGQVITGDRIEFSFSHWQFHVRRMCDDERSRMMGEVLFEWATLGLGTLNGLKYCFEAGTPVMTDQGLVPIEDLKPGDRVLSRDEETGTMVHRRVVQVFVTPDQPIYELKLSDDRGKTETFHSTGDHPFFQRESGWMRAADLLPGDEIFTSLGGWLRVSGGTWTDRRATVYNIEVEDTHTYFVGHHQAWVHNVCVLRPAEKASALEVYEVGTANSLKTRSMVGDLLDIHHVAQAHPMKQLVPGYSRDVAPAIAIPQSEHIMIPTLRGVPTLNPRQLLARDIQSLRNYTNAPNNSLRNLIHMNKKLYPEAFKK